MRSTLVICLLIVGGFEVATVHSQTAITEVDARQAFFTRMLAPRDAPAAPATTNTNDRNQQRAAEAADFHRRGLVFAQQGAWREAESAFRDAERRNDRVPEYVYSAAYAYLRTHKPNDAWKRYEAFYKKDPTDLRALVGMIAAREESQLYREAVTLWQRYVRMPLPEAERQHAEALLAGARELFAARYEIGENPAGGAANLATPQQELEWGIGYARELASSGVPLLTDPHVVRYVEALSERLVKHAKGFPTNYQLFVLDTAGVNATTVPGFIFVYRGLIDASPNEAALAGVLAHEIGHSVAHHTAKKVTRSYQDEQQLASLKQSDSKVSKFLAKLLEAGNPVGALTFSREAEAQADRLAVHIMYDAGFAPEGLADMFQVFEQRSPSTRNSWDLLTRSHPFSIDRINAVREYAALLPARDLRTTSEDFAAIKERLRALPPASDATGQLQRAASTGGLPGPPETQTSEPSQENTAYTLAPTPFGGRMPVGWTTSKQSAQVTVFNAPAGTPEAEATYWIRMAPRVQQPNTTIDGYVADLKVANAKTMVDATWEAVEVFTSSNGNPMRAVTVRWTHKTRVGQTAFFRAVFVFLELEDYMAIGSCAAPDAFFDRLLPPFQLIWRSLTQTAPAAPAPPTPPTSPTPPTLVISTPPFVAEMPRDWTMRVEDGDVIVEGAKGTEPYEMTIRLMFYEKPGKSLDAMKAQLEANLARLPEATVTTTPLTTTTEGRAARAAFADFTSKNVAGQVTPFRQLVAIVEYPEHFVVLSYMGPVTLFDKYLPAFERIGETLRPR